MKRLMDKLKKIDYATIDVDIILDGRDNKEFDSNWMRVYKAVDQLKKDNNIHDSSNAIREDAFMTVYNLSGYRHSHYNLHNHTLNMTVSERK